ncbi:hypothetical protein DYB32_005731 [Aphanomyces invadans]|uniref:Pentacotripeptide-repeat region of PRORP domain-containing protein n=1 Tax=Aphanomyces invadans TaxID=157072 RepID=A0A418ATS3_9STRA|nr:hypothetical protein DYB32_005731 [Aphanomyces invadans]
MLARFGRRTSRDAPLPLTVPEEARVKKELAAIAAKVENPSIQVTVDYWRDVGRTLGKCRSSELLEAARPLVTKSTLLASPVGSVHNEMIRIMLNLGLLDDVIAMAKSGALPLTGRTVSRILGACVRESTKDKTAQAFALFDLACANSQTDIPHMSVFHSLFILCAKSNDHARLAQVKAYMEQHDVALDAVCHGIYLRMDCRAGKVKEAIVRYHELTKAGMTLPVNHLNDFLDDLTESDHYDDAVEIFEALQAKIPAKPWGKAPSVDENVRHPLNVISYNIMIKVCGKEHRMDEAFKWYEAMKSKGLKPSTVTINTMLHGVFHGQFRRINSGVVYTGLAGLGAIVGTALYTSDLSESGGAVAITSAMLASMAVGIYVNPFGVKKAIYPNESGQREPVPQAILRRLDEEEHIGRLMFLWQELLGYGLMPDPATFDILVRTCVRKRHPELAATVLLDTSNPNSIASRRKAKGNKYQFELSLATTVQLLQALVAQNLLPLFDQVFHLANSTHRFEEITKRVHGGSVRYALGVFQTPKATALALVKLLNPYVKHSMPAHPILFEVQNSHAVLDMLDVLNPSIRSLFVMEDVQGAGHGLGVVPVNRQRLEAHFKLRGHHRA